MKKKDLLINTNGYILSLLEKILDANVQIKGIENIPRNNPRIFVANHFTRTEAMLVPYTMYNLTGKKVGVIADDSLFKTYFGDFLSNLGAMKKSDPLRNNHIIGDLVTSCKDWMVFPEGRMVKAKDIEKIGKHFCVKIDGTCQRIYTGASYFALLSQALRQDYFNHKIKNFKKFQRKYFINDCSEINENDTMIVPINISYSKIRNGRNFLIDMVEKLIDNIGKNFKEELEIETNIVLNSKIIIQVLEPISTKQLLQAYQNEPNHSKTISAIRYETTHNFMNTIYQSLTINFDHIFILVLFLYPKKRINIKVFKRLIYLVINKLRNRNYFLDDDIDKDLIYLISYEKYEQYEEVLKIAIDDDILYDANDEYIINKQKLLASYTHHTIRIKNILKVILNEVLVNEKVVKITKDYVENSEDKINKKIVKLLIKQQKDSYLKSYMKFKEFADVKNIDIGENKYLDLETSDTCIITVHGFSSSPKEVEQLSIYLHSNGFAVYSPRLDGHGTSPEDLKNKKWEDWYKSVSQTITIASIKYKKVFIIGFSTGGLLSLLSANKIYHEFTAIVCINAALNLKDIRVKTLLPAVSFWNEIVKLFNSNEYSKDYIENNSENPKVNYDKFYVDSIKQLSILMDKTRQKLINVTQPCLIIQAKDDPIVNASSAYEIFEKISSKDKELVITEDNKHIIINTDGKEELFEIILKFIKKNLYPQFLH
ncbi:alpha/beta fold hydrolase [Arcobacter sp. YIC-310]|uniref:alpha/beta fold hydrolase n=1 Tax=Arcobacter sp. YIC-310 TaxID=3376632 RepID=UPI003C1920E8